MKFFKRIFNSFMGRRECALCGSLLSSHEKIKCGLCLYKESLNEQYRQPLNRGKKVLHGCSCGRNEIYIEDGKKSWCIECGRTWIGFYDEKTRRMEASVEGEISRMEMIVRG